MNLSVLGIPEKGPVIGVPMNAGSFARLVERVKNEMLEVWLHLHALRM